MKFCPSCGNKIAFQDAKFCPECGFSFKDSSSSVSTNESAFENNEEPQATNVYDLGNRLEEVVEKIFRSKGYVTFRRQRITGISGTKSEIDIIAQRGNRRIAIECKNYSSAVGIDKVRDFSEKLRDLELDGVFVSLNGLTQGAEDFAKARRIETMDSGELSEKWLTLSVGRTESARGQTLVLEYALPINVSFDQATKVGLVNRDKIKIIDTELIFHPYFFAEYSFSSVFKDPTRNTHKFKDTDTLFVDALDGKVLNQLPEKGLGILKAIKSANSSVVRAENARTKKLLAELTSRKASIKYELQIEENYKANKLKPAITLRQASEAIIDFIIEKNTFEVSYSPKSERDEWIPQKRQVTFTPKRSEIRILRKDIVVLPRWSVEFESVNKTYRREILASSGEVIEDTMFLCPRHFKVGSFSFSQKRTVAVCEICGEALCEEHVKPCAVCGKWLCGDDAFECEVCKKRFCKEHNHFECSTCNGQICTSCIKTCPVCLTTYSPNHSSICDKCGQSACPKCILTTGLIRKNRTCKKCLNLNTKII